MDEKCKEDTNVIVVWDNNQSETKALQN